MRDVVASAARVFYREIAGSGCGAGLITPLDCSTQSPHSFRRRTALREWRFVAGEAHLRCEGFYYTSFARDDLQAAFRQLRTIADWRLPADLSERSPC